MASIKKILRYIGHYGLKSTVGLVNEKLRVDPKRFSSNKERTLPNLDFQYKRAVLPDEESFKSKLNVMYLIHYFYPTKKGGTERFTLNVAKEQVKLGNKPTVLVLDANESKAAYTEEYGNILYRHYTYDGIDCIGFRHKKAPLGLYYKDVNTSDTDMAEFAEYITKRLKIDVVHATYPQPFSSFLIRCRDIGLPYVVTCTDFCMMCHYSSMVDTNGDFCAGAECGARCEKVCKTYGCNDFAARHKKANEVLLGAKTVTVPSEFVARVLGNEFPEVAFVPVAHGISDSFTFSKRDGKVTSFVYAGTISQLKGIHLLIDAFNKIPGDITLDIYGEGDEAYLKRLKASSDERIKFHGAVHGSLMPEIYSSADCVIVPSMWYETYNFVLREALKTGALVLASDIGAMPEAVDVGKNGFLFAPSSTESLCEAIRSALDFDFSEYSERTFPTLKSEARTYSAIYSSAKY